MLCRGNVSDRAVITLRVIESYPNTTHWFENWILIQCRRKPARMHMYVCASMCVHVYMRMLYYTSVRYICNVIILVCFSYSVYGVKGPYMRLCICLYEHSIAHINACVRWIILYCHVRTYSLLRLLSSAYIGAYNCTIKRQYKIIFTYIRHFKYGALKVHIRTYTSVYTGLFHHKFANENTHAYQLILAQLTNLSGHRLQAISSWSTERRFCRRSYALWFFWMLIFIINNFIRNRFAFAFCIIIEQGFCIAVCDIDWFGLNQWEDDVL